MSSADGAARFGQATMGSVMGLIETIRFAGMAASDND